MEKSFFRPKETAIGDHVLIEEKDLPWGQWITYEKPITKICQVEPNKIIQSNDDLK